MRSCSSRSILTALGFCCALSPATRADEPKPKPENTIKVSLAEPVAAQAFPQPVRFFIADVTDRSGNPQPMLVYRPQGGVFLDRKPTEIAREALGMSLKAAGLLAPDRDSADLLLTVYLFHFGLARDSGMDFFGKVEFAVTVRNPKTGKSQQVSASGTSIAGRALLKKNVQKNVEQNIERALGDAVRNFLRGTKLRQAVQELSAPKSDSPAPPAEAPAKPPAATILKSHAIHESCGAEVHHA